MTHKGSGASENKCAIDGLEATSAIVSWCATPWHFRTAPEMITLFFVFRFEGQQMNLVTEIQM